MLKEKETELLVLKEEYEKELYQQQKYKNTTEHK